MVACRRLEQAKRTFHAFAEKTGSYSSRGMAGARDSTGQLKLHAPLHFFDPFSHLLLPGRSLLFEAVQVGRDFDSLSFRELRNLLLQVEKRCGAHGDDGGTVPNPVKLPDRKISAN
jgi:hypothetical protein